MITFYLILLCSLVLGVIFFAFQPAWAIIECAISERKSSSKAIWLILILVSWSLGGLIYAVFITNSKKLKTMTVIFGIPFLVILALSGIFYIKDPALFKSYYESSLKKSNSLNAGISNKDHPAGDGTTKTESSNLDKADKATITILQATSLEIKNDFKGAILLASQILENNPENVDALSIRAKSYIKLGDKIKGTADFLKAIEVTSAKINFDKENYAHYKRRGTLYLQMKKFDSAEEDMKEALSLKPDDEMIEILIRSIKSSKSMAKLTEQLGH